VCLLDLQKERVLTVAAHHQGHPVAGADAPDPDHLAGQIDEPVAVEEMATVPLEALAVAHEQLLDPLLELVALIVGDQLAGWDEQGWIADDPRLAVDLVHEPVERLEAVLRFRLRRSLVRCLRTAARVSLGLKLRSRTAISKLAAKRLTSHSQGPGSV